MRHKAIILFCVIGAAVFLILSIVNLTEKKETQPKEPSKRLKADSTAIDLSYFNNVMSDQADILAIGVMTSASCAGCGTNLLEYSAYIDSVDKRFFSGNKIDKVFAVVGNTSEDASRFKKIYDLKEDVLFFHYNSKMAYILSKWKGRLLNQWVFINKVEGKIFSRIMVLTAVTPLIFKKDIINRALFATEVKTTTSNP